MDKWSAFIPFVGAMTGSPMQWNTQRILEAVIIGIVTATITGYVSVQVIESRLAYIERDINQIKHDLDRIAPRSPRND